MLCACGEGTGWDVEDEVAVGFVTVSLNCSVLSACSWMNLRALEKWFLRSPCAWPAGARWDARGVWVSGCVMDAGGARSGHSRTGQVDRI